LLTGITKDGLKAAREICIAAKLQGVSVSTGDRTRRMAATLICQKSSSDIITLSIFSYQTLNLIE
jgi:hypothetical protein